ncbi:CPBP family intramembrane glutamic endopeptidase [Halorussus sp. MSC15.2]|uniref:CPBP family intramembrane glutamic endopeptidase n=1 Tax=Halorussus sp. MSC15.2 TaxID=2283638 RepID=UPI0013CF70FF|nr:CPBP family intramembrane glutamic endopeptidase [Halorussus sp. MSC15.2]NEU55548.1 CPBP family intramembrane metalloprotease [Halorussus sp. MSC15.2]
MGVALSWAAIQSGQRPEAWGYHWSRRSVGVGILGVGVLVAVSAVTGYVDGVLFAGNEMNATFTSAVTDALRTTPSLALVFLLGNGVFGPIAEEQVWRGIVQTDAVEGWGVATGIGTTALLFAFKHVVVDGSVARLTTLLAMGLVLGLLRHRSGTVSSTVAHIGVNTLSTAAIVFAALG